VPRWPCYYLVNSPLRIASRACLANPHTCICGLAVSPFVSQTEPTRIQCTLQGLLPSARICTCTQCSMQLYVLTNCLSCSQVSVAPLDKPYTPWVSAPCAADAELSALPPPDFFARYGLLSLSEEEVQC
jgi:hypothetical protein